MKPPMEGMYVKPLTRGVVTFIKGGGPDTQNGKINRWKKDQQRKENLCHVSDLSKCVVHMACVSVFLTLASRNSGRLSSLKGCYRSLGLLSCVLGALSSPQGLLSDVLNLNDTTFNCTRHLDLLKATSSRCPATTSAPAFGTVLTVWPVLSGGQGTPLDVAQVKA